MIWKKLVHIVLWYSIFLPVNNNIGGDIMKSLHLVKNMLHIALIGCGFLYIVDNKKKIVNKMTKAMKKTCHLNMNM